MVADGHLARDHDLVADVLLDGADMTDLEITRLCAQAMGVDVHESTFNSGRIGLFPRTGYEYEPLHEDAQAMALVKKLELSTMAPSPDDKRWQVSKIWGTPVTPHGYSADLNRAICECCAKMEQARQK